MVQKLICGIYALKLKYFRYFTFFYAWILARKFKIFRHFTFFLTLIYARKFNYFTFLTLDLCAKIQITDLASFHFWTKIYVLPQCAYKESHWITKALTVIRRIAGWSTSQKNVCFILHVLYICENCGSPRSPINTTTTVRPPSFGLINYVLRIRSSLSPRRFFWEP